MATFTATCQHSGLTFEARSKAAKNHPAIAELLTDAHKRNTYAAVVDALHAARDAGVRDLATFEQIADAAADGRREEQAAALAVAREREERAKRERRVNEFLARHGYEWSRPASDEESADAFAGWSDPAVYAELTRWTLHGPDGRMVTVREALEAISAGGIPGGGTRLDAERLLGML